SQPPCSRSTLQCQRRLLTTSSPSLGLAPANTASLREGSGRSHIWRANSYVCHLASTSCTYRSLARSGGRLGRRGPYTDWLQCAYASRAADQGRQVAGTCGNEQDALAVPARRANDGRSRLSQYRGGQLGRNPRPERNAERHHRLAPSRDRQDSCAAGHEGPISDTRLRPRREHAGGIRPPNPSRDRDLGEGDPGGGHQGGLTRGATRRILPRQLNTMELLFGMIGPAGTTR